MGYPGHWINWIHLEDVAHIFLMALGNDNLNGPYNAVAPNPVTIEDFSRMIARVLKRPCLMKYPVPLLKIIIGEAGEYTSGGARCLAHKIQENGYRFFFDELEPALENLLIHK